MFTKLLIFKITQIIINRCLTISLFLNVYHRGLSLSHKQIIVMNKVVIDYIVLMSIYY